MDDTSPHNEMNSSARVKTIGITVISVATVVGFVLLLLSNAQQQKQIDTLTQLAQEAQLQTQQLSLQLEELVKANEVAREQVELLRSQVAIYENSIKTIQTAQRIDELLNKQDHIPFFRVYQDFSDEKTVGSFYEEGGLLVLENIGSECLVLGLKPNRDNDFEKLSFHHAHHKHIESGGNVAIIAQHRRLKGSRLDGEELDFDLFYRDADGNHYKQRFYGEADEGKWKMHHNDPVLAVLSD